jgi:hypothetical protein
MTALVLELPIASPGPEIFRCPSPVTVARPSAEPEPWALAWMSADTELEELEVALTWAVAKMPALASAEPAEAASGRP